MVKNTSKDPNTVKKPISKTPFIILVICLATIAIILFPIVFFRYNISYSNLYIKVDEELKNIDEVYDYNTIIPGDSFYFELKNDNLLKAYVALDIGFKYRDNKKLTQEQKEYLNYLNNELLLTVAEESVIITKNGDLFYFKDVNNKTLPLKSRESVMVRVSLPSSLENKISEIPKIHFTISLKKSFFGKLYF